MEQEYTREWWLWQMYRLVAEFVNEPSGANEARLRATMARYQRYQRQCERGGSATGQDWAVDCG